MNYNTYYDIFILYKYMFNFSILFILKNNINKIEK